MSPIVLLTAAAIATGPRPAATVLADTACPAPSSQKDNKSPIDSMTFTVGGKPIKMCYARPSSHGQTRLGGSDAPYGRLWQGEPLTLFTPITLSLAGLWLPPGAYVLYTLPGETEWVITVNGSLRPPGPDMWKEELARATVEREWTPQPVEMLTLRTTPAAAGAQADTKAIVLEWERTRVTIPVADHLTEGESMRHCTRSAEMIHSFTTTGSCYPVRSRHP